MQNKQLIKAVERLVDPVEGGAMHVIQQYNQKLPVTLQHKLIALSAKKNPYMGFIVEPYAFFSCHKILDFEYFEQQLHSNFKLVKSSVFAGDTEEYYLIIGSFGVRTSAFFGNRIEAYAICEDQTTGMLTWVIIDVLTNTISYEQRNGLIPANAEVIITTGFDGDICVSAKREETSYEATSSTCGESLLLDSRLWIEGNLSVGYGANLSDNADVFSLLFDVREVERAVKVKDYNVDLSSWFGNAVELEPRQVLYFPYAQHFISASPGTERQITSQAQMEAVLADIDFEHLQVYSSKSMFKLQQYIMLVSVLIILGLIISLIIT